MNPRIIPLTDLNWSFDQTQPYLYAKPKIKKGYGVQFQIDPFPCYPHDIHLIEETAKKVEAAFPLTVLPNYYVLHYEEIGRTNGHTSRHSIWIDGQDEPDYEPYIVLSGKRIPPHPAMTRYLVAHEYGHVVRWHVEKEKGYKASSQDLYKEYCKLRDMEYNDGYGGKKWHSAPGEVFANDFRILICETELEFWPHDEPYPTDVPAIKEFWQEQKEKL